MCEAVLTGEGVVIVPVLRRAPEGPAGDPSNHVWPWRFGGRQTLLPEHPPPAAKALRLCVTCPPFPGGAVGGSGGSSAAHPRASVSPVPRRAPWRLLGTSTCLRTQSPSPEAARQRGALFQIPDGCRDSGTARSEHGPGLREAPPGTRTPTSGAPPPSPGLPGAGAAGTRSPPSRSGAPACELGGPHGGL